MPQAIRSSREIQQAISFSAAYCLTARSMGVGPQAKITSAVSFSSRTASSTLPLVPALPSSVATYTVPSFRNSSSRNRSSRYPRIICFSPDMLLAVSSMGGIPMPPPISSTFRPLASSRGKPLPKGPMTSIVSPCLSRENSSVPFPAIRYTSRSLPCRIIDLTQADGTRQQAAAVAAVQGYKLPGPGFSPRSPLACSRRLKIPVPICSCVTIFPFIFTFILPPPEPRGCPPPYPAPPAGTPPQSSPLRKRRTAPACKPQ